MIESDSIIITIDYYSLQLMSLYCAFPLVVLSFSSIVLIDTQNVDCMHGQYQVAYM